MDAVALVASVLVGVALVVAGAAKLVAREEWPVQAAGLRAPRWTVPIVPWFELGLGSLLVVQVARRPLAVAAAALFVVFTVLIAATLRRGERPPCACFGAWSASPLGAKHLIRNAALIALAIVAAL